VYCSIAGKSQDIYDQMFDIILKHVSQRPQSITIDFEKSVENVIKQQLPTTTISFCFFHFKQNLWKQIQVSES
jgi:transposase-like protein